MTILFRTIGVFLLSLSLLTACGADEQKAPPEPENIGISINGLNYTNVGIPNFYVNGVWGGNLSAYDGGGGLVGGGSIPRIWSPNYKVKVTWYYGDAPDVKRTAEVTMPKYTDDQMGYLLVAFLPGEKVEVFTTMRPITDPAYPGSIRMTPGQFEEFLKKQEASHAR